jgi:Spy/CpxP family protein refolding chaperone
MKTRTRILAISAVAVVATVTWMAAASIAQPPGCTGDGPFGQGRRGGQGMHGFAGGHGGMGGFGGMMGMPPLERIAEKLELTDEQIARIEEIRDAAKPKRAELRKRVLRLQNSLQGELLEDDPDKVAALELVASIGEATTELRKLALEERLEMRAVLTDEQRDELMSMRPGFGRGDGKQRGQRSGRGAGRGAGQGNGPVGNGGDQQ